MILANGSELGIPRAIQTATTAAAAALVLALALVLVAVAVAVPFVVFVLGRWVAVVVFARKAATAEQAPDILRLSRIVTGMGRTCTSRVSRVVEE